jgi:chromosome segregation ATPase
MTKKLTKSLNKTEKRLAELAAINEAAIKELAALKLELANLSQ